MPQVTAKAPQAPQAKAPNIPVNTAPVQSFGQFAVPINQSDVDALQAQRSELSSQLISAKDRRNELSRQLKSARPGPDQAGIEARLTQLDARIISIENDIAESGRALSAAPSGLTKQTFTSTGSPARYGQPNAGQITGIAIVGTIFVLAPIAIGMTIRMLRRPLVAPVQQISKDMTDRLDRMEQGIEAVAVEVERIGEGQRFVTQLMSDRASRAALPDGVQKT